MNDKLRELAERWKHRAFFGEYPEHKPSAA
jgi:hypothetical protein